MKKVISVLVALMMLISVFSVSAFAAVNDAVLAIRVTPTATTYAKGDVVTFEVSYESTSEIGTVGACTLHIGYDNTVFEPVEDLGTGLKMDADGFQTVVLTGYALEGKVSAATSFVQTKGALAAADTAKGWNECLKIALTGTGTLFEASTEVKVLAFKLKVKDSAAGGNYAVGVTQGSVEDYSTQVVEELGPISGPSGADYEFSVSKIFDLYDASVTVEGGTTPPPATVKVNNLSTQVQWANKDAGLMNLGFRGQIADGYDATADDAGTTGPNGGKNLAKLTEVGFYLNGTKYQSYTIYNFVDGGYFYRVVVGNVSYDSETEFSAQAYVVINGTEYKAADATTITTTGKAQYERAKDAMGAK